MEYCHRRLWNRLCNPNTYAIAADITLYAKWTPDVYTVTYNNNGGTGNASETSHSHTYGTSAFALATVGTMSKSGYSFMGWLASTSDTSTVASPYIPSGSITLYAYWLGNTYSIKFDENGATSGTATDTSYISGSSGISLPNGSTLTRTGYVFGGWSTTADGANLVNSSSYTTSADVTLFAKWTPKIVNITYLSGTTAHGVPIS